MADDSFSGIAFHVRTDSGLKPELEPKAVYTVMGIPGSNDVVIDNSGTAERRLKVPCLAMSHVEYLLFPPLLATFGTLVYNGDTYSNVYLADISAPQRYNKDETQAVTFGMEFII